MINAMIFAAGLGTRLKPFTENHPKALAEINGVPLLMMALRKIERLGIKKVVVNVHHFAEQVISFIEKYASNNLQILISDESQQLMNTGGGLLKAAPLFDDSADILIYNVDVITNAPIENLIKTHQQQQNLATLMVQKRDASRFLLFNSDNQLIGWRNPKTEEELWANKPAISNKMGFNGIQIIQGKLLKLLDNDRSFPIIPEYIKLSKEYSVRGWSNWKGEWMDVGTPEKIDQASKLLLNYTEKLRENFF